jgi:hypothetical protein
LGWSVKKTLERTFEEQTIKEAYTKCLCTAKMHRFMRITRA